MKRAIIAAIAITILTTSGCAFLGGNPEPSATPPRLVRDWTGVEWNYPGYFGLVPPSKQLEGDALCSSVARRAVGYHPRAEDMSGHPFPNGGFLCSS